MFAGVGFLVIAAVFTGLAILGRRDARADVAPDSLPEDLRAGLGLWRDENHRQGAARAESAFLSPQFVNSRTVVFNAIVAVLAAVTGVLSIIADVVD